MAGRKKQQEGEAGAPLWLVTYSDMVTLLLTFFILLLSFSTLDNRKLKVAIGSLRGALGVMDQQPGMGGAQPSIIIPPISEVQYPEMSNKISKREDIVKIKAKVAQNPITSQVETALTDKGIILTIMDSVLFESGQAFLVPTAFPVLSEIGSIISSLNADVRIAGHTDDTPVSGESLALYPSNWELSTARAMSVLRYFVNQEQIDPRNLSVGGYGSYRPRVSNETPEGRRQNRRVEIIIEPLIPPPPSLSSPFLPGQEPLPSDDLPHSMR